MDTLIFIYVLIGNVVLIVIGIIGIYLCIRTLGLLYHRSNNSKYSKSQISSDNNPSEYVQDIIKVSGRGLPNSHFNISEDKKDEEDGNCSH